MSASGMDATPRTTRHVLLFNFRAEASPADRRAVLDGLAKLPSMFPAMKRFGLGQNVSRRDQTFSYVMTLEFDERRQLDAYLDSPEHEHFVATCFRPYVEQRVIASYDDAVAI